MRLPWFLRKAYDAKCAEQEQTAKHYRLVDCAHAYARTENDSFNALLDKYPALAVANGASDSPSKLNRIPGNTARYPQTGETSDSSTP